MALIFLGSTECALCNEILQDVDEVEGLPPSPFHDHELWKYFDAGFHKRCFDEWEHRETVFQLIKKAKEEFIQSSEFQENVKKYGRPKWVDE